MVAIILTEVKAMRQKVRKKDKTAIALVLCFCVIALASVFTLKANINKVQAPAGEEVDASKRVEETAKTKPEESITNSHSGKRSGPKEYITVRSCVYRPC